MLNKTEENRTSLLRGFSRRNLVSVAKLVRLSWVVGSSEKLGVTYLGECRRALTHFVAPTGSRASARLSGSLCHSCQNLLQRCFTPRKNIKAFTLAEVLITLGIIGVVAAMTIPTLINKTNDIEMKSAWRKAYSELSQVQQQLIVDNGGVDFSGQCSDYDNICLRDLFANKIKTSKICINPISDGCVVSNSKYIDGSSTGYSPLVNDTQWPAIITNSGYSVKFRAHQNDCSYSYPRQCGWMQIDINGLRKPNVAGKDIFYVAIAKDKLVAFGDPIDNNTIIDCNNLSGMGCSAVYLHN